MLKKSIESPYLRSFIRRNRIATQAKKDILENMLPQFELVPSAVQEWMGRYKDYKISLELGFGNGEHLLKKASIHPDEIFIGCEPYMNGVAQLLKQMQPRDICNIYIYTGDAREILEQMPNHSLSNIYILFPDPWPKTKHLKRRIINNDSLSLLSAKLRQDGRLLCATDHLGYAEWIFKHLYHHPDFVLQSDAQELKDCTEQPHDWCETKYERKAHCKSYYFNNTLK